MVMRVLLSALAALAISACHSRSTTQRADANSVVECINNLHSNDDYVLVTACVPLQRRKIYRGTWYVGFELSLFRSDSANLSSDSDVYELVAPSSLKEKFNQSSSGKVSTFQLSFMGRESARRDFRNRKIVVLDQPISFTVR